MAEGIKIEIFRLKNAEDFTKSLADPTSRMETGSGSAMTAAVSSALLERAASLTVEALPENERAAYICRNAEILRSYMVHLIDEDVKSRGPLKQAMKKGDEREIEAARQPAVAITSEIINMMGQNLEFARELCAICPRDALHYLGESAHLALAAIQSARIYTVNMSDKCSDETYRFVVRRENELSLQNCKELAAAVIEAAEAVI